MRNRPKWYSILLIGLVLLLTSSAIACNHSSPPKPPLGEEVISALDTDKLLDIGYNHPEKVVTVEGVIVKSYYCQSCKGKPTFLNFHDPYQGYFSALIWGDDRHKFPSNPESYYLNEKVRVKGEIEVYKGSPEIVLSDQSQIWIVE